MMNPIVLGSVTGLGLGAGLGVGGAKVYKKVTGKAAGVAGSPMHIATNDKLDKKAKAAVVKEQLVESGKDTLALGTIVGTSAGAAAIAAGCSSKVQAGLSSLKQAVKKFTDNIVVKYGNGVIDTMHAGTNESIDKTLTQVIKNNKLFKKFNNLTTPAKAAIAAGAAALALVAPIVSLVSSQKAGYIEGKHESDALKRNMPMQFDSSIKYATEMKNAKVGCVA